jgi:hypothetical protein
MAAIKSIFLICSLLKNKRFTLRLRSGDTPRLLIALQLLCSQLPLAQGSGSPIVNVAQVCGETGRKGTIKDEIRLCPLP